ncbi:MAG TPA: hypothetical protein VNF47_16090 [Streptosporangiaceae bacterium]|nr:hypothetical protein [Streptosporangiaceae bacterium]
MSRFGAALGAIAADLDSLDVGWAVVGGCALNAHGTRWPYRDIDLAISLSDDDAIGALAASLRARGHGAWQVPHGKLGLMVLVLPHVRGDPLGVLVDVLPRACAFETELVAAARPMTVLGVRVPVACVGHLIAFKVKAMHDATRPHDPAHLRALVRLANGEDLDLARQALLLRAERVSPRRLPRQTVRLPAQEGDAPGQPR